MKTFSEQFHEAESLRIKYRDMPRKGWAEQGSRKKSNETIEVSRVEAEQLALRLGSVIYLKQAWLYEAMALLDYIEKMVEDSPEATRCAKCHRRYLPTPQGTCPYCEIEDEAVKRVESELYERDGGISNA